MFECGVGSVGVGGRLVPGTFVRPAVVVVGKVRL